MLLESNINYLVAALIWCAAKLKSLLAYVQEFPNFFYRYKVKI